MQPKKTTVKDLIKAVFSRIINRRHLEDMVQGPKGKVRITKFRNGKMISKSAWYYNTVPTASNHGRDVIAQRAYGLTTYDLEIDSGSIGTGSTSPSVSDTDLETPVETDLPIATKTKNGLQLTYNFFIADANLADGTYREFGLFMGNQMLSRALFGSAYTKSTGEDTQVEYVINF